MQKPHLLLILLFFALTSNAKELKYNTLLIPDSLKKDAYAIVRNEDVKVEILSPSHTRTTILRAVTVLKAKGKSKAYETYSYDKNNKIVEVSARMYNALGKEVDKWNRKDWYDYSYDSYSTAYSDTRMLQLKPAQKEYPYTVEYKVVTESNQTYGIDGWYPIMENNLAIEKSSFHLSYSRDVKAKYKEYNITEDIKKTTSPLSVKWEINNMQAYGSEPFSPSKTEYAPFVRVGVKEFKYGNYSGKSENWKEFGNFRNKLNTDRNELPAERKAEVDKIMASCKSDREKVETLYKYMQSHTRYVNIQEGIGGIQPFPASTVSENGYGDCKALSNYMGSLLKYVGIKSYYTLIKAGAYNYGFDPEFVCHQSNHAILCVPMPKDTIWLECTSQTAPCGFLGSFTDNRPVLLITEEGGKLARTPKYDKKENLAKRSATVNVTPNGDCSAKLTTIYSGLEFNDKRRVINEDQEERLKLLYNDFDIPNFKIDDFKLQSEGSQYPKLNEELNLSLPKFASKSGSRLFLPVNLASKWDYIPKSVKHRKFDIHFSAEFTNKDSITFNIPEGYIVEVVPEPYVLETKYGIYKTKVEKINQQLVYSRHLEINSGVYPAGEYEEFITFFKKIKKNDNAMAILKQEN